MTAVAFAQERSESTRLAELERHREIYRIEREKRIRQDGIEQYIEVAGEYASYNDDPYAAPIERDAVSEDVEVMIVGGGFAALMTAARLKEQGIDDVRMIEKAGDFGGTWYWNRYPGAQCDVESYIYMPLLEETGYIPTEKYAYQPEIFAHAQRIGRHFDLYRKALFQTQITTMDWDEARRRWIVRTDRGDEVRARYVVLSSGPLHRIKLPGIPGIHDFKGRIFHGSRWDYGYTGGSWQDGRMTKLADKRVAVIGTGASSIQIVPKVAEYAGQLIVVQRTPSTVSERGNRPTDPEWVKTLEPGWQRRRIENFTILVNGGHQDEDLVNDAVVALMRSSTNTNVSIGASEQPEDIALALELEDLEKMNRIRARIDEVVKDEKTAAALKPWYRTFCKRPAFHDEYLDAFNRDNVTLVDTEGRSVERITETGFVVGGIHYEVDCIVFATGFEVGTTYRRRAQYEVRGRNGVTLDEHWSEGLRTLHGFYSHGFPNCFHMGFSQNGFTQNYLHMVEEQATHVSAMIKEAHDRQATTIEVSAEAEGDWVRTIRNKAAASLDFLNSCTPAYINGEGKPGSTQGLTSSLYAGGPVEFWKIVQDWRADGQFSGVNFS